jgi:hypothetical protein
VSSVPDDRHVIEAPARVFDSQAALQKAFTAGELERDVVCVVRWQGPQANGMPELHKLTPPLSVLQGKGFRVALVTDGRMSGASGKVPAAIHVSPEAAAGGPLGQGARRRCDPARRRGRHPAVLLPEDEWAATRDGDAARRTTQHRRRPRPRPRTVRRHAPQCIDCRRRSLLMAMNLDKLTALDVMRDAPVIPVIVLHDVKRRRAAGARAGGRRHPHARGHAAHAAGAAVHRGHRQRSARGRGRRWHHPQRGRCAGLGTGRREVRREPGLHALGRQGLPRPRPAAAARRGDRQRNHDGAGRRLPQLKFFPAMQAGGLPMLKAWQGPFGDVTFCPTGGIHAGNAAEFLALSNVACVGGSWIVPTDAIQRRRLGAHRATGARGEPAVALNAMQRPGRHDLKVIAFDVFGTVVDWHGGIAADVERLLPGVDGSAFALAWRAGYQPAMKAVMDRIAAGEGGFTLLDELHLNILEQACCAMSA